ncbi:MAG: DUF192 domain-containing protein [Candidatus Aenigmatarchaeota archaeon]
MVQIEVYYEEEVLLDANVADSTFSKMKGLMFKTLDKDECLLMVFDEMKKWEIWMLLVPQNLGLIFLDDEKRIVDKVIAEKVTLNPKTWRTYKPNKECKYIVECNPDILDNVELDKRMKWDW